jgi:sulfide:quinone oxidoreductase
MGNGMNNKCVVILGGGIGGLVAANELRQLLPKNHRIILIERNKVHAFAPSYLWVMNGTRQPQQIVRPTKSLLRSGIGFILGNVNAIDTGRSVVETDGGPINYDYLIVALGAELAPRNIPGLGESSHTYYTLDGSTKLNTALKEFQGGSIALVVASMPYKCPGAPLEGAMLIADFLMKIGRASKFDLHLFTPESQPMPVAGPVLGKAATEMLTARGISYHPLHKLISVSPEAKQLEFEGKGTIGFDLLVAIPPHSAPAVVRQSTLANESGWIPVDRASMATKVENVFAIGDVTSIPIPGRWKPDVPLMLPKAGVFAHVQASVVAKRIVAKVLGRESSASFCGDGYCMLEAGEDLAGFAYGNFFAEPSPEVKLKQIGKSWHIGKVLFEKWWLEPYGIRREVYRQCIALGSRVMGIPSGI